MKELRIVSDCEKHQYFRLYPINEEAKKPLGILGLNPSFIKNGKNSTVSILSQIALREGYDSLIITNLYGYITPNPKYLKTVEDPVGPGNDMWIVEMVKSCDKILCIWGNNATNDRIERVLPLIKEKAYMIGLTKSGKPRHVLHTRKDAELKKYS
jgi:hypothetical protein